jgi:TM2 domain-containing membrane protein YozV
MVIGILYTLIFLIFLFLSYLIIKSVIRGIDGKNKNKNKK